VAARALRRHAQQLALQDDELERRAVRSAVLVALPISPVTDQQLGGLVIWIAGGLTIGIVFLVVLARMLDNEERGERAAAALRVAKPVLTK
jgi:cytochrome c oxidase assembly factor CtaG